MAWNGASTMNYKATELEKTIKMLNKREGRIARNKLTKNEHKWSNYFNYADKDSNIQSGETV